MEVDLRGEGEERQLHWFLNGKQQKHFFTHLPPKVQFCVWTLLPFSFISWPLISNYPHPHHIVLLLLQGWWNRLWTISGTTGWHHGEDDGRGAGTPILIRFHKHRRLLLLSPHRISSAAGVTRSCGVFLKSFISTFLKSHPSSVSTPLHSSLVFQIPLSSSSSHN